MTAALLLLAAAARMWAGRDRPATPTECAAYYAANPPTAPDPIDAAAALLIVETIDYLATEGA